MNKSSAKKSFNAARFRLGFGALLLMTIICLAFTLKGSDDFELAKQELILRKIGHEILLNAGDSTSRVLPIKKVSNHEYQIRFENEFTFQPDSLVKIIANSMAKDQLQDNYIVNVLNCAETEVIFGYAIFKNEQDNIVACSGRVQPKACYIIDVKFQAEAISPLQKGYLIGGLPLLAFVGLLISRSVKREKRTIELNGKSGVFKIGHTVFDFMQQRLLFEGTKTILTTKENKLLFIFANAPNQVVERSRLQKEIWEDEGVIVGRSLDVFISKLRKKLEKDVTIQLINIHGRGYRMEINQNS